MNEPYLYHNIHSASQFGIFNNQLLTHMSHPNSQSMDQISYSAPNIRILTINQKKQNLHLKNPLPKFYMLKSFDQIYPNCPLQTKHNSSSNHH
jgi:hypothetical protein